MSRFTHIHSSSKFSGTDKSLENAAKRYNARAALVTYTEVEDERREGVLRRAGKPTHGFVSGDESYANDCAIAYRKDKFELVYSENFKSTNVNFYDQGGKKKDPQWVTFAVLYDPVLDKTLVVGVVHLASGIEGDMRVGKKTKAVTNWYASFAGTKRRANKLKRIHKADAVMIVADWNVSFKQEWFTRTLKALAPMYRHTWRTLPAAGTHAGGRVIDGTIVRGRLKGSAKLFQDDNSSDHRPYIESLQWT